MYYSYDSILSFSINNNPYIFPEETMKLISDIKKELCIYNKSEPFNVTKINKQVDYCGSICKLLNKLTDKNYNKLKGEIIEVIENIQTKEEIDIITTRIFHIASSNIHSSNLFASLYKELIDKNKTFYIIFQENFKTHSKSLSEIEYISPNENYDAYCNYVKKIESLKAGLSFFSNLMKCNICTLDQMVELIHELMKTLNHEMCHKNNMEYKEELLQSIFIIIKEIYDYLAFHKDWESIYKHIVELKSHSNINSKLKFKCMDIIDYIKDYVL
jgi:hypothetical protein